MNKRIMITLSIIEDYMENGFYAKYVIYINNNNKMTVINTTVIIIVSEQYILSIC